MKSIYHKLILILFVLANDCFAQKVTNITAEQVGQTIQVSYNLDTESPCTVSLFYSTDNGVAWQGPLKKVTGDVGEKILRGANKITWDVLNEMEQLKFSSVVFKIDARKPGLKEVKIGNQIWSAENLNTDRFANGEFIPEAKSNEAWVEAGKNQKPIWCYYNFNPELGDIYGKLYNWYAVIDSNKLCPIGWHVPSDKDWTTLENYLGGSLIAAGKLKDNSSKYWMNPNKYATNIFGFTGLPGGSISNLGIFYFIGENGIWWTSSPIQENFALFTLFNNLGGDVGRNNASKSSGLSVRCIKD
jgi:uncharacterized protein (TIGR02145 family)